jgi:hypothetical protein
MVNREVAVAIMISFPVAFGLLQALAVPKMIDLSSAREAVQKAPVAISGNNIYTAWDNATLHGDAIFFTKSNDGGKMFSNTMVLSPPNTNPKISVTRNNVSIHTSGNNIAVTWWTN